MIESIKLINFRNFDEKKLDSIQEKNFIIWKNGAWKTNTLEALSLLWDNSFSGLQIENFVKKWESVFYIEYQTNSWDTMALSYDIEKKKRNYILNGKHISKQKFNDYTYKCVVFSPIIMNLMYLSPSLRRDFLDSILSNSFPQYSQILKEYKKIIASRNKVLKNISEGKSQRDEVVFWNEKFIEKASEVYKYRFKLIHFFESQISQSLEYFNGKIEKIEFIYKTKIEEENIEAILSNYINDNIERDIILAKTPIWPHVDDFDISVDDMSLVAFASRWETKSVILWLKLLEIVFTEKMTWKKPILLIDDLLSELDEAHKNMFTKKIKYYQTFITSIDIWKEKGIIRL